MSRRRPKTKELTPIEQFNNMIEGKKGVLNITFGRMTDIDRSILDTKIEELLHFEHLSEIIINSAEQSLANYFENSVSRRTLLLIRQYFSEKVNT
jgi:hypothetical protein